MEDKGLITSKVLLNVNPTVADSKLIVNKDIKSLEDLRKEFKLSQSTVLGQVQDFLPKMATANADLQRRLEADPDFSADIEDIDDDEAPHIEMNLALVESDYSSEDSGMDSDTSSDAVDINYGKVNENNIKLSREKAKHGRPLVEDVPGVNESK